MTSNLTIDTNILIYSVDRRDPSKHEIASRIVSYCLRNRCTIALQALNEFFRAVTGKGLLQDEAAMVIVNDARFAMKVVASIEADMVRAMTSYRRNNLQFLMHYS